MKSKYLEIINEATGESEFYGTYADENGIWSENSFKDNEQVLWFKSEKKRCAKCKDALYYQHITSPFTFFMCPNCKRELILKA